MASPHQHAQTIDGIVRDLDMVVYRMEQPKVDEAALRRERQTLRHELEQLRDKLDEVARSLAL